MILFCTIISRKNGFTLEEDPNAPPGRRYKLKAVPFSKNIVFGSEGSLALNFADFVFKFTSNDSVGLFDQCMLRESPVHLFLVQMIYRLLFFSPFFSFARFYFIFVCGRCLNSHHPQLQSSS